MYGMFHVAYSIAMLCLKPTSGDQDEAGRELTQQANACIQD